LIKQLGTHNVGLICLSAENLGNPWIHFEAGALASRAEKTRVCPLLIDLKKESVPPPLSMFQFKTLEKDDVFTVFEMINEDGGDRRLKPDELREAFENWWPKLEEDIMRIKSMKSSWKKERSDRDILEEVLNGVRSIEQAASWERDIFKNFNLMYQAAAAAEKEKVKGNQPIV
jgi:hypothetical protein